MKKMFEWKTVLKGLVGLLVLATNVMAGDLDAPGTYEHDAYWASLDAVSQPTAYSPRYGQQVEVPSAPPSSVVVSENLQQGNTSESMSAPVEYYAGTIQPDGLFLHNISNSAASQVGSSFLGPGNFFVDGYISQGLRYGNADKYFQPMGLNDKEGYQLDQLYFSFGRKVQRADRFSIGVQVDVMYGSDYYYMSAVGLETHCDNTPHWNGYGDDPGYRAKRSEYGFALPQAFAEVYMPILNGLDVKVGHFDSVMGYESLQSNRNFFYSQTYSKIYGMPTSMTGAIGTLSLYNGWNVILGGVNEWNAFDTPNDNFSGVIGLTRESADKFFTFAATFMLGEQTAPCYQYQTYSENDEMCYVFNTYGKFRLTDRLSYVCEFTAGYDDRDYLVMNWSDLSTIKHRGRAWFGLTNAMFYQLTEKLALGTRFEWFADSDSTIIDGGYEIALQDKAANYFALTVGANWTPVSWMSVRPEIRYDFSDFDAQGLKTYDEYNRDNLLTVGTDVIVRF